MTYRGFLLLFLCFLAAGVTLLLAINGINLQNMIANATGANAGITQFPVSEAFQDKDGTVYLVGQDGKILIRDPDGNLRTIPASAFAH
jgi:hypothetical protein